VEHFFVRNHGPVPEVDRAGFRLRVGGEVERELTLSLDELTGRFSRHRLTAALQCAGNRRLEMMAVKPIPGELGWGEEAIGNAAWSGVRLTDLLAAAGVGEAARHVELVGLDETERHGERFCFGGSIPLAKALAGEVLLAWEMNDAPLPPAHGAPLRAVVPGYIGARSVKWLTQIRLRSTPSENYFQARAYRLFAPEVGPENVVWEEGEMLGELRVGAIITAPGNGAELPAGRLTVRGVAMSGGGRRIERVEASIDGGASWRPANLEEADGRWSWRLWAAEVELTPGEHEILARATDEAGQQQPESPAPLWNFKGYMNNAWSRLRVLCR
jgi:sulfite oxidase